MALRVAAVAIAAVRAALVKFILRRPVVWCGGWCAGGVVVALSLVYSY
jgi:hypothetical protein